MTVCSALYVHRLVFFSRRVSVCVYIYGRKTMRDRLAYQMQENSIERKKGVPGKIIYQRCNRFHPARRI